MDGYLPTPVSREIVEALLGFDLGPLMGPWWQAYADEHERDNPDHWSQFRFPEQAIRDFEGYLLGRTLQGIDHLRSMHPTPRPDLESFSDESDWM